VTVRSRYRYRAEVPREAWLRGREPRERARRKDATKDLIDALDIYLMRKVNRHSPSTLDLHAWVMWATSVGGDVPQRAPDGTEWLLRRRWELY
jgi:hypothetical protein